MLRTGERRCKCKNTVEMKDALEMLRLLEADWPMIWIRLPRSRRLKVGIAWKSLKSFTGKLSSGTCSGRDTRMGVRKCSLQIWVVSERERYENGPQARQSIIKMWAIPRKRSTWKLISASQPSIPRVHTT